MQTDIAPEFQNDPRLEEVESILRTCVHCGFCLATCPTYKILGDEADSPRGRIYQIKQVVEGQAPTVQTLTHLDRCLTCRNCETTCPSGVQYGRLIDHGRAIVEERIERDWLDRLKRRTLLLVLPYRQRIGPLVTLGQLCRPLLPGALKRAVPAARPVGHLPARQHARSMVILDGCVQPSMAPTTDAAAARVLDALGISLVRASRAGCCGAVHHHLNEQAAAKALMRKNIDAWWPLIEAGAEAILITASGCGVVVKEYGHILANDPAYADKAAKISALCVDPVEVLQKEDLSSIREKASALGKVAFHPPCTLQHGQKLQHVTERLLKALGFDLTPVADSHLCCGSAGTYSLFQPGISHQLRDSKVSALVAGKPDIIATANIGCQLHLQSGSGRPVLHWVELIDQVLPTATTS